MEIPAPEEHLLGRFREGDVEAWRTLFERYSALLTRRVASRLTPGLSRRLGVSDIVQETGVAAFDARETFVGETLEGFRRWLFGIADHKVTDAVRRHQEAENRSIEREVADPDGEWMEKIVAPEATPSEIAMAGEMADLAGRARDSLPADHQEVLRLVREHGLTFAETAERMGRSREAVKKLYGRAVVSFRRAFEELRRGVDG